MNESRGHLSKIQDLCTGDDVELVLGSTYGLREWSVLSSCDFLYRGGTPVDLRLFGHYGSPWDPTVAFEGVCAKPSASTSLEIKLEQLDLMNEERMEFAIRTRVSELLSDWPTLAPILDPSRVRAHLYLGRTIRSVDWMLEDPLSEEWRLQIPSDLMRGVRGLKEAIVVFELSGPSLPHPVGHPLCTCGIYAYHDKSSLGLRRAETARGFVVGLVRAFGHVTLGTKGLRAAKAQVVALTLPQQCDLPDRVVAPALEQWKDAGISVFSAPEHLFDFATQGGYLERPEDLQPPESS